MGLTFAIVTPSYNKVRYLRQCVLSVLEQQHPGVDYWLLDSCSNDGSAEVIDRLRTEFAGRLNLRVEKDHGQTDAINRGFTLAKGEIMGWLNADDFYVPGTFRLVEDFFLAHPEVGMVYGHARILDRDSRFQMNYPVQSPNRKTLRSFDYIPQPTAFWRRHVWDAVGPLDMSLNWGLDWDFFIRVSERYPVVLLDAFLADCVCDGEHKTAVGGLARTREFARISRRYGGWTNPTHLFCHYVLALHWLASPWLRRPTSAATTRRLLDRLQAHGMTWMTRILGKQVMY